MNAGSIARHGLLSTEAVLAAAPIGAAERCRLGTAHRTESVTLPNGMRIRDQRPMPPEALARCLVRMMPEAWYALLNARVFFWLDAGRLNRMRLTYRAVPQILYEIDTEALIERHAACIELSPINTGFALRQPALRGQGTFVPYGDWLARGWAAEGEALGRAPRSPRHAPVELTVLGGVPDLRGLVVRETALAAGEIFDASTPSFPLAQE